MKTKTFKPSRNPEFAILDFKAVLMHCLGAGNDEYCRYDSVTGREVNTAEHGFRVFLDMYVTHLLDNFAPWQILVCHEGGHVYRSQVYPDYKSNRKQKEGEEPKQGPETGEEYEKLAVFAKQFLAGIGATQLHVKGVEGDDVIAHLVEKLSPNYLCYVYSVDADMLRLASDQTMIMLKMKHIINRYDYFDEVVDTCPKNMHAYLEALCDVDGRFLDEVKDNVFRFVTLYKSIIGDSADGYSGIKGMGDGKWTKIVQEYGIDGLEDLENIVENHDWATLEECLKAAPEDKILSALHLHRNDWRMCWNLAKLHPELCWKPSKTKPTKIDFFKRVPDAQRVMNVLTMCNIPEFFDEKIADLMPQKWLIDADNFDGSEVGEFAELCKESFVVGWDYETWAPKLEKPDAFNAVGAKPTGISFCLGNNFQYAFYITMDHKDSKNLPLDTAKQFLEAIPEDTPTVAHNLYFETTVTAKNYDFVIEHGYDTAIMSSYVDENEEAGLKACSKRELNYTQETYEEVMEKACAEDMRGVTAEQVMSYGIDDSIVCCHLFVLYWLRLQLEGTWDFYRLHEPVFTKRTALSQIEGVNIDFDRLKELHEEDLQIIATNDKRLREILEEHCSKPNVQAAKHFVNSDIDFITQKAKADIKALDEDGLDSRLTAALKFFEDMTELDEEAEVLYAALKKDLDIAEAIKLLIDVEVYKKLHKAVQGSIYVPYKEYVEPVEIAPTLKNLNEVCLAIDLPLMESVAVSKLSEWEAAIRNYDFEEETDDFDNLTEQQQEFLTLLEKAKPHFKKDARGHEDFQAFNLFCAKVLGKKPKVKFTGCELNAGSPQQMQHMFYCMLGLPVRLRSNPQKGSARDVYGTLGSPGTNALVVDTALAEDVEQDDWRAEALRCLKMIRESETRVSLYHTPYPQLINPETGKVHPSLKGCGTVTRRPTGSAPNILQVSKHQRGGNMRSIYKPLRDDHIIIAIDFAGQELRMLASVTKDFNLLSCYLGEAYTTQYLESLNDPNVKTMSFKTADVVGLGDLRDLHSLTGSGIIHIFGLDENGELIAGGNPVLPGPKKGFTYEAFSFALHNEDDQWHKLATKVRKKPAKTTNFLMAYGGSAQSLSQKLIIKESDGQLIVDGTMDLYPGIERAQAEAIKFAKAHGYVETAYGNRRHATENLFSNDKSLVNREGRQLFNATIQGCAADVLKAVLRDAEELYVWDRLEAIMMAPVYDEIVASVPYKNAWRYISTMTTIMNLTPPGHAVPMMADVSLGHNWQAQVELGSFPSQEDVEEAALAAHHKVLENLGRPVE